MSLKLYTVDTATQECELMDLTPYPEVTALDGSITILKTVNSAGKATYDIKVTHDVNMDVVSFDPASMVITMTETDGDLFTIDLSTLRSIITNTVTGHLIMTHNDGNGTVKDVFETITGLSLEGAGIKYIDEAGASTIITLCGMMNNATDNGNSIGG